MAEKLQIIIEGDAKKLIGALKKSGVEIDKFAGKSKKASSGLSKLNASVGQLAGALGLGFAASQMVEFGKASFMAFAEVERLEAATQNLSGAIGETSDSMLTGIVAASGETIDKMTALKAANKAMMFDLVENKGQMAELTEIAVTLGAAMGQDAAKSLDDLTTALGRQSPMILDNLGITLKLEEAYRIYADSLGKSVESLTEQEKKQAFVNAALIKGKEKVEELGGVSQGAATDAAAMTAAWADLQVALGGVIATASGGLGAVTDIIRALERGATVWQGLLQDETFRSVLGVVLTGGVSNIFPLFDNLFPSDQVDNAESIAESVGIISIGNQAVKKALQMNNRHLETTAKIEKDRADAARIFDDPDFGAYNIPSGFLDDLETVKQRQLETADEAARAQEEAADRAKQAWEQSFSELKGVTSGVLGEGLNVLGDLGLDLGGNAGRDVAENARRIAAIFAGDFSGEAAQLLQAERPELFKQIMESENPQETARKLLEDFQLGIGAGAIIDKDAAKDRIKRILFGDAEMKALTEEISRELMAEGFSPDQIQNAMNQAGLGGENEAMLGTGAAGFGSFSTGFLEAVDNSDLMMTTAATLATSAAAADYGKVGSSIWTGITNSLFHSANAAATRQTFMTFLVQELVGSGAITNPRTGRGK